MSSLSSSLGQLVGAQEIGHLERRGGMTGGGGGDGDGDGEVVVSEVIIYPVKSCRGISLPSASLQSTGLEWDRQWQVVNEKGRFITQRQIPKMALIEVSLPMEALDRRWGPLQPDSALSLEAPGMEALRIPLITSRPKAKVPASTWEWSGLAFDEGDHVADWLSKYLGKPGTRLVRFDTASETRPTDPEYAQGFVTAFSDGYPILLISKASLNALNDRLPESLPMNRFRPNIVVEGCEPFAEDLWRNFKIGASPAEFQGVKLCSRCKITTTNQATAEVGREPLASLGHFRRGNLLSTVPNMKTQVYFGQNVVYSVQKDSVSTVNVGDKVRVLRNASSVNEVMTNAIVAV